LRPCRIAALRQRNLFIVISFNLSIVFLALGRNDFIQNLKRVLYNLIFHFINAYFVCFNYVICIIIGVNKDGGFMFPVNSLPMSDDPIRIIVQMEEKRSSGPAEESTQDKVKRVAAVFLVLIGMILLAQAFCLLTGATFGLLAVETSMAQALFLSGLSAVLGGFSLQNSGFKGSVSLTPPGLPLTLKMEQK
jgi:hypothetical protein